MHDVQFRVLEGNGGQPPPELRGPKETVYVPDGNEVKLALRFDGPADPHTPYLYHCHPLRQEDRGMMGRFVVVESGQKPGQAPGVNGSHDHHGSLTRCRGQIPHASPLYASRCRSTVLGAQSSGRVGAATEFNPLKSGWESTDDDPLGLSQRPVQVQSITQRKTRRTGAVVSAAVTSPPPTCCGSNRFTHRMRQKQLALNGVLIEVPVAQMDEYRSCSRRTTPFTPLNTAEKIYSAVDSCCGRCQPLEGKFRLCGLR
ncbi:multicopper oxidase domain-containing protein [Streptomyces sp. NPDC001970]